VECRARDFGEIIFVAKLHVLEEVATAERKVWQALQFGTAGEVDSDEAEQKPKLWFFAHLRQVRDITDQFEINSPMSEALIRQSLPQLPRTKLIFDVIFLQRFFGLREALNRLRSLLTWWI